MRVRAQKNLRRQGYDILFWQEGGAPNTTLIAQPAVITVEPMEDGQQVEPTLTLDFDMAEELFQSLWDEGLRPKTAEGTSAHVEALQDHLATLKASHVALLSLVRQQSHPLVTADQSNKIRGL